MTYYDFKLQVRSMTPFKIREAFDKICYWLKPRQKWLTSKIPNHWIDKDTLWELCILEGIKHYVEKDNGLGYGENWLEDYNFSQNDPTFPEWQKKTNRETKEKYDLITKTIPHLELQLKSAWDKVPMPNFNNYIKDKNTYEETYGEVDKLEAEIDKLKTEIMVWAVTNRHSLWS